MDSTSFCTNNSCGTALCYIMCNLHSLCAGSYCKTNKLSTATSLRKLKIVYFVFQKIPLLILHYVVYCFCHHAHTLLLLWSIINKALCCSLTSPFKFPDKQKQRYFQAFIPGTFCVCILMVTHIWTDGKRPKFHMKALISPLFWTVPLQENLTFNFSPLLALKLTQSLFFDIESFLICCSHQKPMLPIWSWQL